MKLVYNPGDVFEIDNFKSDILRSRLKQLKPQNNTVSKYCCNDNKHPGRKGCWAYTYLCRWWKGHYI